MATSFIDQTYTFEGTDAQEWYTKYVCGAPTLDMISIHSKVKNSVNVPSLNISRSIQADSCNFTAGGDITASTKKLTVTAVAVKKELCVQDFEPLFLSQMMKDGSNEEDFLPADFATMLLDIEGKNVLKEVEEMIWNGDTAGGLGNHLDEIDGYIKQMVADASIVDVLLPATLTAANITTEIGKVVQAIPKCMKKRKREEKVGIGISCTAAEFYREAISANSPVHWFNLPDDVALSYNGWKLFVLDGLVDDDMIFCDFENLWFGTDLFGDIETIKIIPLGETTGDDLVRLKARFKVGVSYGTPEEIVLYHIP